MGVSFASILAQAHCNIAAIDIVPGPSKELLDLQSKHDVSVRYYKCDISAQSQVNKIIAQVERDFGRIDINVNAAGIVTDEQFITTSEETLKRTFAVNVYGSVFVAQACAASIIKRIKSSTRSIPVDPAVDGGSIVFVSSISTHIPSIAQKISAYVGSKAAIRGMVKPLAVELAPFGIRVNSLSPGYMMTNMMESLQQQSPDIVRQFEKETLLSGGTRIGRPEELQGPLLLLCSRKGGGWMTGQDILVDGGAGGWKHVGAVNADG